MRLPMDGSVGLRTLVQWHWHDERAAHWRNRLPRYGAGRQLLVDVGANIGLTRQSLAARPQALAGAAASCR